MIFKGASKSIGLTNAKVSILLDNALQHFSRGCKKKNFNFLLKYYSLQGWGWGGYTRTCWGRGWGSISHPRWE